MKKKIRVLAVSLLSLLVILQMMAPAFAESEVTVDCSVETGCNGCPELVFTAKNGLDPEDGVMINVTMDGFSEPFYNGTTDENGALVLTGVPVGNYTWASSYGYPSTGNVNITAEDFPVTISDRAAFWLWFMAFRSNATDGEKGRYLLQAIANYTGYNVVLPSEGSSNYETATSLMPWICKLEKYIYSLDLPTLTSSAIELGLYTIKSSLSIIGRMGSATIEPVFACIGQEEFSSSITVTVDCVIPREDRVNIEVLSSNECPTLSGMAAVFSIFVALFDLAKTPQEVTAAAKPYDMAPFSVENLNVGKDWLTIAQCGTKIIQLILEHFLKEESEIPTKVGYVVEGFGFVIGLFIMWGAATDYGSRYSDPWVWEHLDDWHVLADILKFGSGFAICVASFLSAFFPEFVIPFGFGLTISVALAATVVGVALGIAMLVLTLILGENVKSTPTIPPPSEAEYLEYLRSQFSPSLTNMFRIRDSLYALNTTELEEAANHTRIFAGYAHEYALEAQGEFKIDLENAESYLLRVSGAQETYRNAVIEAREPLDNLIKLHLNYTWPTDPSKKIIAHLEGINSTKADFNGTVGDGPMSFQANASICYYHSQLGKYCFDAKNVTSENLNGTLRTEDYPYLVHGEPKHWVGWAFETPVEHALNGDEIAVTYNITDTGNYFHVDDRGILDWDNASNWQAQMDNGTFFLYKFCFDHIDEEAWYDWLNGTDGIQGDALTNVIHKLNAVQNAADNLTLICTYPNISDCLKVRTRVMGGSEVDSLEVHVDGLDYASQVTMPVYEGEHTVQVEPSFNRTSEEGKNQTYVFDHWDLGSSTDNPLTIPVTDNTTITACYAWTIDLNRDCMMDIFDIVIIAATFGSTPNDPNWNPIADIVNDNIIDIFDIVMVANDFGEESVFLVDSPPPGLGMFQSLLGGASISLYPDTISVYTGATFSTDVKITDVTNLYGWEFQLYWNSTVLNCTNVQVHTPGIWGENSFEVGLGVQNSFNATHGRYWKALSALYPASPFSGSMTIATLTFQAIGEGTSALTLEGTKLADSNASAICHTVSESVVTVVYGRYLRGDTHAMNGLNAYKLGLMQSSITKSSTQTQLELGLSGYWGIQVWKRSQGGTETQISSGVVAQVSRTSQGQGLQSATWNCPQTSLNPTDTIVVRVYQKIGTGSWQLAATFTTEQLGDTQLDSRTWTVYYYTKLTWTYRPKPEYEDTKTTFYWGTTTYNSRINNLKTT